jgi:hypothetical protein
MEKARLGLVGLFTLGVVLLAPQVASQDMSLSFHISRKFSWLTLALQSQQVIN